MKRILIFCLPILFLSFSPISSAQKMLQEGNQWNVRITSGFVQHPFSFTLLQRVYGDTIIDNVLYKKLWSTEDSLGANWKLINSFLREDDSGKVFLLKGENPEEVLYDFSLLPGNTFDILNGWGEGMVVDSTDFITLNNGEIRKRLFLSRVGSAYYTEIWIEGIGSITSDFLNPAINLFIADIGYSNLLCFSNQGELLYPESSERCYFASPPKVPFEERVMVYPNPSLDQVFINDRFRGNSILEIRWYDGSGGLLRREIAEDGVRSSSVADFPNGVYLLQLIGKDGETCVKRIVKE